LDDDASEKDADLVEGPYISEQENCDKKVCLEIDKDKLNINCQD
jgi:hypothetical protein